MMRQATLFSRRRSTRAISENGSVAKMLAITGLVGQLKIVLGGTAALHTYRVWGAALTWLSGYPSSRNAVSFSSRRKTNRFPPRSASAIQIVWPYASNADTQPQLHPALLRLSAMISQYFMRRASH